MGFLQGLRDGLTRPDPQAVADDDELLNAVAADTINPTDDDPDVDAPLDALLDRL